MFHHQEPDSEGDSEGDVAPTSVEPRPRRKLGRKVRKIVPAKNPDRLKWGSIETVGEDAPLSCPIEGCTKSYTREDRMRKHLRKHHSWTKEQCKAVKKTRKGVCPDCGKALTNVSMHRRMFCPVVKAAKAAPVKKTLPKRQREICKYFVS